MRYSHFAQIDDPGQFRRILTDEQAERVRRMRDERRLSWPAIARWFAHNGTSVSWQTVRRSYGRAA
jgi:hypothetical protein